MRYLIGFVCLALAAGFVVTALAHRRRVASARAAAGPYQTEAVGPLHDMTEIVRPLILGALVYVGLKTTLVFFAFGAVAVLSYLDLIGFLVFLAAFGFWLTLRTKHQMPGLVAQRVVKEPSDGGRGWSDRDVPRVRRRPRSRLTRADIGAAVARAEGRARPG